MAEAKQKKFYVSPRGKVAPYAWLNKADTKFKTQGEYKVNLIVPEAEGQKLADAIQAAHDRNYEVSKKDAKFKGKRLIEAELPYFYDEEEGSFVFKFKCNASYIDKKDQETKQIVLRCVDSQGERMPKVPAIGAGSSIKVRFSMLPFAAAGGIGAGIKLQMDSLMLIELVEFSAGGAGGKDENWGDEVEEGGFRKEQADHFNDEAEDEGEDEYSAGAGNF